MDLMGQGILLTVIGMGTVFVSLAVLAVLIRLIDVLVARWEGRGEVGQAEPVLPPPALQAEGAGQEGLLPVIAAAVGAYLEAESAQVFVVPVERPDRSRWVMEGRVSALSGGEGF